MGCGSSLLGTVGFGMESTRMQGGGNWSGGVCVVITGPWSLTMAGSLLSWLAVVVSG